MTLLSQAAYARRLGVTSAAISQWKKGKRLVFNGHLIDVEKSDANLKKYRRSGLPDIIEQPKTVKRGRLSVKQRDELNTEPVRLTCAEIMGRLAALDYTQTFDWSDEAKEERTRQAAQCIGWEAVESDRRDDGHWGGFQLRIPTHVVIGGTMGNGVAAGYGFELHAIDVLMECRTELEPIDVDDEYVVRLDLLHLLARPFHEHDKPN